MSEVSPVEYLYGTYTAEDADGHIRTRVVPFQITRKTARRIYYVRRRHPDGLAREIGYVGRQALEAADDEGVWARRTAGWWEPDNRLFVSPPPIPTGRRADPAALKAELDRLRAEMAAAHPDRGGTDAGFVAAHKRYEAARNLFHRACNIDD